MAYFERNKIEDSSGQVINPAENENIGFLRRIFSILKPLSVITGGGSNRLNIDVNAMGTVTTVTTVTTCSTVTALNNVVAIGSIPAFDLMKAASRTAYNTGIRSNIT